MIDQSTSDANMSESGRREAKSKVNTPPSPRRSWMKIGVVSRARSVENMQPMVHFHPSPRPKSPPLTLASGSPGVSGNKIPKSPYDTPPKKLWEHGFKSFLSRRSQAPPNETAFPEVPLMVPTQRQTESHALPARKPSQPQHSPSQSSSGKQGKESGSGDQSVRGGKFFQNIFGGAAQRSNRRKTKSLNQLDEPMRNGKDKNYSPSNSRHRRVQSQANVVGEAAEDELNRTLRRAAYAGTSAGAIVPPPPLLPNPSQHTHPAVSFSSHQPTIIQQRHQVAHEQMHDALTPLAAPSEYHPYHSEHIQVQYSQQTVYPHNNQSAVLPVPNTLHSRAPSGASSHSMSPSSATTEIKKAFTEFHNSSRYARDSTSAYLGDEPSTRRGDSHYAMFNPGLVAHNKFASGAQLRNYSNGSIESGSGHSHRFLSSSLPTVDENVSIHKSMRMLRPFQMTDSWQSGRRYLIGPAAMATCPLLPGMSKLSLSSCHHTRREEPSNTVDGDVAKTDADFSSNDSNSAVLASPAPLPPLFGCIVLGKALLSYVVQEPTHHHQQRWWSSCILILRQNYLFEYDQQTGDVLQGLPRGYAHLQHSTSYPHPDFLDALELEFFVSPCAKADKRVLTIRLQEAREKRDNWIACLNRAAHITIKDMYKYDDSGEVGRGRYAAVYPAKRRAHEKDANGDDKQQEYDCALKIIDKKEFWRRVVKGRERADTIVREASVQATITSRCSKLPAFVRLQGFLETSDHVVLELELMKGLDLFQYVSSKGVLCEKEAAYILRDILSFLDGTGSFISHRDIKPANCLVCETGEDNSFEKAPCVVKIGDFGMATFVGVDGLVRGRCGTPGYVAPEIFSAGLHGGYGNKVDVFSAGVTLYVMLCGYEPFYGESDEELVAANKEAKLDFPSSDWQNVSSDAKDLVRRMMEPDPKRRFSAKEALKHPWIVQHVGNTDSDEVLGRCGVESLSHSLHKRGETCIIS